MPGIEGDLGSRGAREALLDPAVEEALAAELNFSGGVEGEGHRSAVLGEGDSGRDGVGWRKRK